MPERHDATPADSDETCAAWLQAAADEHEQFALRRHLLCLRQWSTEHRQFPHDESRSAHAVGVARELRDTATIVRHGRAAGDVARARFMVAVGISAHDEMDAGRFDRCIALELDAPGSGIASISARPITPRRPTQPGRAAAR